MDRDRSRSPRATNYEEIVRLVVMREQARLTKDWASADSIREKLTAAGVTIYDKTNSWKSSDGQTGRIPTWSELEAGQTPEAIIAAQEEKTMAVQQANGSDAHIKYLVQMREQARASKDWGQSDKLRDDLKVLGVELFDKEKMWRSKTGSSGVIIGYRGAQGPTDLEISTLVVQRERARQSSDYTTSDMIRDELKAAGVDINDREKIWRSNDGRQGPVPTWTAIQGGGGETTPMLAPPAVASPAVAQANAASLRNQVVQAALAAAQNPASAVRTLQLLQQAGGAQSAPAKTLVRPTAPAMQMQMQMQMPAPALTAPVAAPARTNQECQEALGFISQLQAQARPPQDAEIDWLVGLREKFRQGRDFNAADELRNAMRSTLGVELHEKEKKWTCTDGRQGTIPMWNALM